MFICRFATSSVIVWLALTVLPNSFAHAGEAITVSLASGRTFTGVPDSRTDAARLWLRFGGLGASVLRPIEWSAVEDISQAGKPIDQAAVLELARSQTSVTNNLAASDPAGIAITIRNAPSEVPYAEQAREVLGLVAPATHIEIYATLENWDADPQVDGLLLHLRLLNAEFNDVVAGGSLQVELFAAVERRFQAVPHGRGASVQPVARWSHAVRAEDFHYGEARLKLPFTAVQPHATGLASPYGLLHARLAVPGQGVFEDSQDGVTLHRFAPTRELLERQDASRRVFTEPPVRGHIP